MKIKKTVDSARGRGENFSKHSLDRFFETWGETGSINEALRQINVSWAQYQAHRRWHPDFAEECDGMKILAKNARTHDRLHDKILRSETCVAMRPLLAVFRELRRSAEERGGNVVQFNFIDD